MKTMHRPKCDTKHAHHSTAAHITATHRSERWAKRRTQRIGRDANEMQVANTLQPKTPSLSFISTCLDCFSRCAKQAAEQSERGAHADTCRSLACACATSKASTLLQLTPEAYNYNAAQTKALACCSRVYCFMLDGCTRKLSITAKINMDVCGKSCK